MSSKSTAIKRTQVMTLKEVSGYLGVHAMTVYKLLNMRKIPGFKLGGQWRFKKDVLDDWMEHAMNRKRAKHRLRP